MMTSYNVLQPIGTIITGSITLGDYLEKMFFLLIGVSGVLAVVMLVVCGIKLMMSEGAGGREAAKKCIWDAIFGLLIAIGAWLLLNTINPQLVSSTMTMDVALMNTQSTAAEGTTAATAVDEPAPTAPGWYIHYQLGTSKKYRKFKPNESDVCTYILDQMKVTTGVTILPGGPNNVTGCFEIRSQSSAPAGTSAASGYTSGGSEASIRGALCGESRVDGCLPRSPALQIQINKRACANIAVYESNCTSVASLPGDAVSFLQSLPGLCGCNIVITGGTEAGHKTHAANKQIFDLRLSQGDALYNAVVNGSNPRPSFSGNKRWLYNGYWFTDEKSSANRHWHVCKDGLNNTYCRDCGSGNTLCPKACGPGNTQCPLP